MRITLKSMALMTIMGLISLTTFTACKDDDKNKGEQEPTFGEVNGYYAGNMSYEIAEVPVVTPIAEVEPIAVEANIANKKISFDKFPVAALITAIVGADNAPAIIAAVGDVKYDIAFTPAYNAAKDAIELTLDPKVLEIKFKVTPEAEEEMVVNVEVEAADKGKFTVADKKLALKLTVTKALIGEANALAGKKISLSFDLLNTVKPS